jgi:folate-binding protein YgfZ
MQDSLGFSRSSKGIIILKDPRNRNLGIRIISFSNKLFKTIDSIPLVTYKKWNFHRITLGIPDGSKDMKINKSFLIENNFENFNGVDFDKGCYLGQENTARLKYKGTLKKRLMKVKIHGDPVANGTSILSNGKIVGLMHSSCSNVGLATIKIEIAKTTNQKNRLIAANSFLEIVKD